MKFKDNVNERDKVAKVKKLNFAVMRSMFGDLWVGGTYLKPNGNSIFADFDEALQTAKNLNDSIENADELESVEEEDVELLGKNMDKWIINS